MKSGSLIETVTARQIYSHRGHPGVEARVSTRSGSSGTAICTAGVSVGVHEVAFTYDGGTQWKGRGVQRAVDNIIQIIAPTLKGADASKQSEIDQILLNVGGPDAKARLGGNAVAAVSAAALKAGAASLGIPLYQHIGGVNACVLPVPGALVMIGSRRYGSGERSGGKPSYALMCYDFNSFSEASQAAWHAWQTFIDLLSQVYHREPLSMAELTLPTGCVDHDRELWDLMVRAIEEAGYEGRIGIQVDVAATTYYDPESQTYVGLFSREPKTRAELIDLYQEMVDNYPFVIIEDPLHEEDYAGHALLTKKLGIEIVGDDLFTTDVNRLSFGIRQGAANTILLKVNQVGTITEAFAVVQLAYRHGYGVMPCDSRGEGADIADYAVGLSTGHLREGAMGPIGNRFLEIEAELGSNAKFLGKEGLKLRR
jgi:enolase